MPIIQHSAWTFRVWLTIQNFYTAFIANNLHHTQQNGNTAPPPLATGAQPSNSNDIRHQQPPNRASSSSLEALSQGKRRYSDWLVTLDTSWRNGERVLQHTRSYNLEMADLDGFLKARFGTNYFIVRLPTLVLPVVRLPALCPGSSPRLTG